MMQEIHRPGDPVADILFNWLPLLGAVLLGIAGLVLILRGYRLYLNSSFLKRSGQPGRARVVKKWIEKGYVASEDRHREKPIKRYFLRFQLMDDPRTFTVKEVAPIELWNGVEPGDTVDVIVHPRRRLMRLAAWRNYSGTNGGAVQMAMGAVMASSAITMVLLGAFEALRGPTPQAVGPDWRRDTAEVLTMGLPADPYLRVFSPGTRMIRVVFGDTHGGAFVANQRIIRVSAAQIAAFGVEEGAILVAWMDRADEYNAILDLEVLDEALR